MSSSSRCSVRNCVRAVGVDDGPLGGRLGDGLGGRQGRLGRGLLGRGLLGRGFLAGTLGRAFLAGAFLAGALAATFLAGAFLAGAFLAGALAGAFLAGAFLAGAFLAGAFLAGALAGAFLAGAFLAGALAAGRAAPLVAPFAAADFFTTTLLDTPLLLGLSDVLLDLVGGELLHLLTTKGRNLCPSLVPGWRYGPFRRFPSAPGADRAGRGRGGHGSREVDDTRSPPGGQSGRPSGAGPYGQPRSPERRAPQVEHLGHGVRGGRAPDRRAGRPG